jgi:hypothetical protein
VEGNEDKFLAHTRTNCFPIKGNSVLLRIDQLPNCGRLPINANTLLQNSFLAAAPGTNPLRGKKLLNPLPLIAFFHKASILATKTDEKQARLEASVKRPEKLFPTFLKLRLFAKILAKRTFQWVLRFL